MFLFLHSSSKGIEKGREEIPWRRCNKHEKNEISGLFSVKEVLSKEREQVRALLSSQECLKWKLYSGFELTDVTLVTILDLFR